MNKKKGEKGRYEWAKLAKMQPFAFKS